MDEESLGGLYVLLFWGGVFVMLAGSVAVLLFAPAWLKWLLPLVWGFYLTQLAAVVMLPLIAIRDR